MRIGLVGYDGPGRLLQAPLIASTPGAQLVGVVTGSSAQGAELSRAYPGVTYHADMAGLIAAGVDSLVIATPLGERAAQVREALLRGLPVVCAAPLARTLAEAEELLALAERRGAPLCIHQPRRWDSDLLTLARLLREKRLGRVRLFESRLQLTDLTAAGLGTEAGLLLELGSHLVDQALLLFGPVERVYAEAQFPRGDPAREREFFLSLRHRSGVVSHLSGSGLQRCPQRLRVVGERGVYSVDGLDGQAEALRQGRTPRSEKASWGAEEHQRWGWLSVGEERSRVPSERGRWDLFYEGWLAALNQGAPLPVTPRETLACQAILEAARQSARTGESLAVESLAEKAERSRAGAQCRARRSSANVE